MVNDILSGIIVAYANCGSPVVLNQKNRATLINGYKSLLKTPIGGIAEYTFARSYRYFDIGMIVNDSPSDIYGTIALYSGTGFPLMDLNGRRIFTDGYSKPLGVGDVVEYRMIAKAPTFDVAWIIEDKEHVVENTIERLIGKSKTQGFINLRDKGHFSDTLKKIGDQYGTNKYDAALDCADKLFKMVRNNYKGNFIDPNHELLNGLKFLNVILAENYSK